MTMWELAACVEGHNAAQGAEAPLDAPTPEEFEELKRNAATVAGNSTVN